MRPLLFLAAVVAVAGCTPSGSTRATVGGTVTYAGKPVSSGVISFWSAADPDQYDQANLKPDGSYVLTNVPFGEVKVTIDATPFNDGAAAVAAGEKLPKSLPTIVPEKLNDKYKDRATTPLTRTVERGSKQVTLNFTVE